MAQDGTVGSLTLDKAQQLAREQRDGICPELDPYEDHRGGKHGFGLATDPYAHDRGLAELSEHLKHASPAQRQEMQRILDKQCHMARDDGD